MNFSFKRLALLILLLLIVFVPLFFFVFIGDNKSPKTTSLPPKTTGTSSVASADVPQPTTTETEIHSPDGKMNLIMEKTIQSSGNSIYNFYVADIPETQKTKIFSRAVPQGNSMNISLNAWSPHNKYFYIKEQTPDAVDYFVFNSKAESFSNGEQFIDVLPIFIAKDTGYALDEVTGWDSNTLLHVFTKDSEGARGPSYWLEIPGGAMYKLAGR